MHETELRDRYRPPSELVLRKQLDHLDPGSQGFIAASPFFVLATASAGGVDASPRGGPPGFVAVLDEHRLAFGDLAGNNRLDSYANIANSAAVGLLFFVPGVEETLRVNGVASITEDPTVLAVTAIQDRRPKVAVEVTVSECFVHCGKAVRRGGLWDAATWPASEDRPSAAAIFTDQLQLGVDPAVVAADLEAGYRATLWEHGGT